MKSVDECFFGKIEMANFGTGRERQTELKKTLENFENHIKESFPLGTKLGISWVLSNLWWSGYFLHLIALFIYFGEAR